MRWLVAVAVIVTIAAAIAVRVNYQPADPRNIGDAPGRACNLPPRTCTERCGELTEMPLVGVGYIDYRALEEWFPETSSSFIRRDLMMLVQYASAKVLCKASTWRTGHGAHIGLGDASQQDGDTPGMVFGLPQHPRNSHVDGLSLDIAYYQRQTPDNEPRPVCTHVDSEGEDQY